MPNLDTNASIRSPESLRSDLRLVANSGQVSASEPATESWTSKALREVQLLKAAGSGFAETASKALGEEKVDTIAKGSVAFALSAGLGRFAAAPGAIGVVGRVVGVGLGVPFLLDIARNAGQLSSAAADAWRSDANMHGNVEVAREHLGRFAFDSVLMTAIAVPGYKIGTAFAPTKVSSAAAEVFAVPDKPIGLTTSIIKTTPEQAAIKQSSGISPEQVVTTGQVVTEPFPGARAFFSYADETSRRLQDDVFSHENGHRNLAPPPEPIAINRPQRTASDLADKPISMYPPAFKTLTADGASPWAKDVHWSLPEKQSDGTWLPGAWMEPKHSTAAEIVAKVASGDPAPRLGLYVSDSPTYWNSRVHTPGSVVYEVQIGDVPSIGAWRKHHNNDFIAQRVRLLRPLSDAAVQ